jgi:hypothetical protein
VEATWALPEASTQALSKSPLVHISPLKGDGKESTCHGEVWFFHDQGDVVIVTTKDTWKSQAVAKGFKSARLWVGDFGPVGKAEDKYRSAPTFEAESGFDTDKAAFERLMTAFAAKYPDEWEKWEPRFRGGYEDGSRVLIRYHPVRA